MPLQQAFLTNKKVYFDKGLIFFNFFLRTQYIQKYLFSEKDITTIYLYMFKGKQHHCEKPFFFSKQARIKYCLGNNIISWLW